MIIKIYLLSYKPASVQKILQVMKLDTVHSDFVQCSHFFVKPRVQIVNIKQRVPRHLVKKTVRKV